jgi:ubiquinone/menaquinone biosynthesis C-methylase UbiE
VESQGARVREKDIYPKLRAWAEKSGLRKILEIGSGQGACSQCFDLKDKHYVGVEPSRLLNTRAMRLFQSREREFVLGNAYQLPFDDESFDGAFSVAVWHLLENIEKASEQMKRVLKPGGNFLIITANPESYDIWRGQYAESEVVGKKLSGVVRFVDKADLKDTLYLHTLEDIQKALESAGLRVDGISTFREVQDQAVYLEIHGQR